MLLLLLPMMLARADDSAFQCQAVWVGPRKECGLAGSWSGNGAGRTETAARREAVATLKAAIDAGAQAAASRTKGTLAAATSAPQLSTCPQEADSAATVTCIEADGLAAEQLCFVDLPERICGYQDRFTLETYGYKAFELGRKQMCLKLEGETRLTDATEAEVQDCIAACLQQTRVRCPGIASE